MITKVHMYIADSKPTKEDIEQCVEIARSESVVVHLEWFARTNKYSRYIYPASIPQDIFERLPR